MLNKMLQLITQQNDEKMIDFISEHSSHYIIKIDEEVLYDIIECYVKGGPGSGCRGENCGRPSSGRNDIADNTAIHVGNKPVRISEGGASSKPPTYTEIKPRKEEDIKHDYDNAVLAERHARDTYNRNRTTENYHAVNRASAETRRIAREAVAAREAANRAKPKR